MDGGSVTLIELREHVGPGGRIRLSWSKAEDGWVLVITVGDGKAIVERSREDDLEALFERCVAALKTQRKT
jgi:hypothetical protein